MSAGPRSRSRLSSPARASRRGLTLIELLVVMAIGVTVMLVLVPITIGLLREGKGLSTEILTSEALPPLHERLSQDLLAAAGAGILPDPISRSPIVQLTLTPPRPEDPIIIYDFEPTLIRRTVRSPDPKAPPLAHPRMWSIPGQVTVLPDELVAGRLGLLYRPVRGDAEVLLFALPGTLPGARVAP